MMSLKHKKNHSWSFLFYFIYNLILLYISSVPSNKLRDLIKAKWVKLFWILNLVANFDTQNFRWESVLLSPFYNKCRRPSYF